MPEPGPGQVTIEVRAIGVNAIDVKAYSGLFGTDESKLPMKLGSEVSGVVTAVGEGAEGPAGAINVGDEVIGYPISGAYAAAVTVRGARCSRSRRRCRSSRPRVSLWSA